MRSLRPVIGIILAGGQSSRMGTNKALLPYKTKRLIDHMAKLLKATGIDHLYVSGNISGYSCIPDKIAGQGPVGGIYSVLTHFPLSASAYLFLPVDMPLLTATLLRKLMDANTSAYFDQHYLPMILVDSLKLRNFIQHQFSTTHIDCSIKQVLAASDAKVLPYEFSEQACFMNANTPVEWETLRDVQ